MRKLICRWQILIPAGLLIVSLGNVLNHYALAGDGVTGFLIGFGVGIEIYAVIKAKTSDACGVNLGLK
ncbi:MAG: hypothetical protein R2681_00375 [Pyrinomonadaceae bacterium]